MDRLTDNNRAGHKQLIFGGTAGGVEDEGRARLPTCHGGIFDKIAVGGRNAQIQCFMGHEFGRSAQFRLGYVEVDDVPDRTMRDNTEYPDRM